MKGIWAFWRDMSHIMENGPFSSTGCPIWGRSRGILPLHYSISSVPRHSHCGLAFYPSSRFFSSACIILRVCSIRRNLPCLLLYCSASAQQRSFHDSSKQSVNTRKHSSLPPLSASFSPGWFSLITLLANDGELLHAASLFTGYW